MIARGHDKSYQTQTTLMRRPELPLILEAIRCHPAADINDLPPLPPYIEALIARLGEVFDADDFATIDGCSANAPAPSPTRSWSTSPRRTSPGRT